MHRKGAAIVLPSVNVRLFVAEVLEEWKINGWLSSSYGRVCLGETSSATCFTSLIGIEKEKQGAHLLSVRLGVGESS